MDELTNDWKLLRARTAKLLQRLKLMEERMQPMLDAINRLPASSAPANEAMNAMFESRTRMKEVLCRLSIRQALLNDNQTRLNGSTNN